MRNATEIALGPVADELLSLVADGVIATDERGLIILFNKSAEEIFEYKAGEVLGKNVNILLPARFHYSHQVQIEKFSGSNSRPSGGNYVFNFTEIAGKRVGTGRRSD